MFSLTYNQRMSFSSCFFKEITNFKIIFWCSI